MSSRRKNRRKTGGGGGNDASSESSDDSDIRDTFKLFDTDKDGLVPKSMVGVIIRAMGKCPTNAELDEMLADVGNNVDVDTVAKLYKKRMPRASDLERDMR